MSVQQPSALWLLALLPLIVLLYILRSQRTQARVTTMRFWRRLSSDLEGRPARRFPLREPLMWLQLLAVALLAVALAGPFVPGGERTHLIVVLDRSASMQARDGTATRLGTAKARIGERVSSLGADDTFSLIAVGQKPELLGTWPASASGEARIALASVAPFLGDEDPLAALALASELARRTKEAKPSIVFYTDSSAGRIDAGRLGTVAADVTVEQAAPLATNVAVMSVTTRQSPTGRGRSTALVTLANAGASPRTVNLRVTADAIALGTQPVTIAAGGSAAAAFNLPLGTQVVDAVIDPADGYTLDDRAFALASAPKQGEIRVVANSPAFWERVLGGLPGYKLTSVRSAMYRPAPAALHVFDGFMPSDSLMPKTPVLIVNPPTVRAANPGSASAPGAAPIFTISRIDPTSPLVRSADLIGLSVSSSGLSTIPDWATVVASTRSGPILLAGVNKGVRTVIMAFDPTKAGLDREVAFPVLVANAVSWLVGDQSPTDLKIGNTFFFTPSTGTSEVIVRMPSGRALAYQARGVPIPIGEIPEPGAYTIVERDQSGGVRTESMVANVPSSQRLGVETGAAVLSGLIAEPPTGTTGAASLLWPWLAAAALITTLVEWVLYSVGRR